jgi:hypothetical protein
MLRSFSKERHGSLAVGDPLLDPNVIVVVVAAAASLVFPLFVFGAREQELWIEVGSLMDQGDGFLPAPPSLNPGPLDSWVDGGH